MASKDEKPSKAESGSEESGAPDLQLLKTLYGLMVEKGLDALELKQNEFHILLNRAAASSAAPAVSPAAPPMVSAPPEPDAEAPAPGDAITSPLAGVFYRASSPNTPAFSKEGDVVEAGQTLCIVEAMKVMNEIKAERRCKITRIVAENSRPVAAGQTLFLVEPS